MSEQRVTFDEWWAWYNTPPDWTADREHAAKNAFEYQQRIIDEQDKQIAELEANRSDYIARLERERADVMEYAMGMAISSFEGQPDCEGWRDTMALGHVDKAGEFLVKYCGWERKEGGSGRRQFYRPKKGTGNAQDDAR